MPSQYKTPAKHRDFLAKNVLLQPGFEPSPRALKADAFQILPLRLIDRFTECRK